MNKKEEILKMSKDIDGLTVSMHKPIDREDDIYTKTIKSLVLERSLNMDWTDACEIVERAVELFAANTKQAGAFSREAVDKAVTSNDAGVENESRLGKDTAWIAPIVSMKPVNGSKTCWMKWPTKVTTQEPLWAAH